MANCYSSWGRLLKLAAIPTGVLLLGLPGFSVRAELNPSRLNQLDVCVNQLTDSGVPSSDAGLACAQALIPKEFSECVSKINGGTPIVSGSEEEQVDKAMTIVDSCFRVRRPIDLANCVVDIQRAVLNSASDAKPEETVEGEIDYSATVNNIDKTPSELAMESCRASLLPGRHSECVIALSRNTREIGEIETAMDTCLTAENFPSELNPAYTNSPTRP